TPPPGGVSNDLDFRNTSRGGEATIDANLFLSPGKATHPEGTSDNFVSMSTLIAAHELGHLMGLRHGDAYAILDPAQLAGTAPDADRPTQYALTQAQADKTGEILLTPLQVALTSDHVMQSPEALHTTLFDAAGLTPILNAD